MIAFLGTGIMGLPMARHLAQAGHSVSVWNRTPSKASPLESHGAKICTTPAEAARGASVLVTMVKDGASVQELVTEEVLGNLDENALWIQATTVGVRAAEELSLLASKANVGYVDAPVVGTRKPAEDGKLVVLASGDPTHKERAEAVMSSYSQRVAWLGSGSEASRMKMVVNSWIISLTAALAESVTLAEGLGLNPKGFLETISGGPVDMPYAQLKGGAMIGRSFDPSFAIDNVLKDVGLILEASSVAGTEPRLAKAAQEAFRAAVEAGHGDKDMAAVYWAAKEAN